MIPKKRDSAEAEFFFAVDTEAQFPPLSLSCTHGRLVEGVLLQWTCTCTGAECITQRSPPLPLAIQGP